MAEKTVVLCEFDTVTEAQVALSCLQEESIPAFLTGDTADPASYSLFGRMGYARIELHVDASQVERAREVLAALRKAAPDSGWESLAESAIDGWMCERCDTQVEASESTCPACGEPRSTGD